MLRKKLLQIVMFTNMVLLSTTAVFAAEDHGPLTEARIGGQLWGIYAVNSELNPFDLDIEVSGDTVTLTGEVDQQTKSDLAEEIALGIDGVSTVNNLIAVRPDSARARDGEERSFGQVINDATITTAIKSRLLLDDDVAGLDIDVSTENHVVTLQGEADSAVSSSRAHAIASETDGVRRVINRIVVR